MKPRLLLAGLFAIVLVGLWFIRSRSQTVLVIETAHGNILIKLFPKDAPETVARVSELAARGFYDGLSFHQVIPGYVIQAGDPSGTGRGGSGKTLKAEFNSITHVLGTVAMARGTDPDSADSQFYISLGNHPELDRKYTVFGQVIQGTETLKKIGMGDVMTKVYLR